MAGGPTVAFRKTFQQPNGKYKSVPSGSEIVSFGLFLSQQHLQFISLTPKFRELYVSVHKALQHVK